MQLSDFDSQRHELEKQLIDARAELEHVEGESPSGIRRRDAASGLPPGGSALVGADEGRTHGGRGARARHRGSGVLRAPARHLARVGDLAIDGHWVDVDVGNGPAALRTKWLEVLSGKADPRVGHVVQL